MNFASYQFWGFLGVLLLVLALFKLVIPSTRNGKFDRVYLLLTSLILFGIESPQSFLIFIVISAWIFLGLHTIRYLRNRDRKVSGVVLAFAATSTLPLLFFKYGGMLASIAGSGSLAKEILIPVGISFYTFQLIGILVDSAKEKSNQVPGALDLFNFASFFPQIVAGPIERKSSLLPQLEKFTFRFSPSHFNAGLELIVLGLFYKLVLADNLAESSRWIVDPLDSAVLIHLGNFIFGLRIYFDFCGYSLIAVGLGKALGVNLTLNFQAPYSSRGIREFWRRWHITLSNWFRDYIYIPLGGNRARFPLLLVLVVFFLSGVWHGAGWNFVIWGLLHGVFIAIQSLTEKRLPLTRFFAWLITFNAVIFSWLFFYQQDFSILFAKVKALSSIEAYLINPVGPLLNAVNGYGPLAHLAFFLVLGSLVAGVEWLSLKRTSSPYRWASHSGILGIMVIAIIWLAPVSNNGFVYFNF